ncbi:calpastatin isoform X13 [Conger conger]|uniref:calpastatin isoform X13 n=1 Tax=Conger conger TaxID=82655 RepID=UPI002A59FE03|nr:calpastatin isoform X13 [Conger conger]
MSQPKPPTSTPVAPVSTVKPAEFESSPIVSSKGETAKTEPSKPAAGDKAAKAAGKPGTPQEVKPKEMPKGAPVSPIKGKPVKVEPAAGAGGARTAAKPGKPEEVGPKETPKAKPSSPSKAGPAKPAAAVDGAGKAAKAAEAAVTRGKPEEVKPKETPKSKPSESSKLDPAKPAAAAAVDGATKAAAEASKGKAKQVKPKEGTKIQVEVERTSVTKSAEEPVLDPFAALAGSLPSEALVPTAPVYTGPEVTEHHITMEDEPVCGEDDDTLPPGYRFENMDKNIPVPEAKPTKPLSTDEALESLSFGFVSSSPPCLQQKQPKAEIAASASSAGPLKSAAPPADKKPKLEKGAEGFSLAGAVESPKPPADKKPKSDESMSLDALSALEDLLPTAEPTPEPPKVRPEDMVKVDKLKSKDAVRVGEREDTLPPDYRFKEEDLKDLPPPKVEPSLDPGEALDFLSGGFDTPAVAPTVQAPVPPSTKAPKKPSRDAVDALDLLSGDLAACEAAPVVQAPLPQKAASPKKKAPPTAASGPAPCPAPAAATAAKTDESMSLDALSALEDLLPTAEPTPEPPKVRPEDMVKVDTLKSKDAVRVGEREDTLPPDYRFKEEDLKDLPPPKVEPSLDPGEALDFLSGGFDTPAVAPTVQAPVPPSTKAPKKPSRDAIDALDLLSGDLAACEAAPVVQASLPPKASPKKPKAEDAKALDALAPKKASAVQAPSAQSPQKKAPPTAASGPAPCPAPAAATTAKTDESMSLDALSALEDLLPTAEPTPEPLKVRPEDMVKVDKLKSKDAVRVGEREDTLPPDYRFKEEDLKDLPPPKVEPSLDPGEALDFLSGGFDTPAVAPIVQAPVPPSSKAPKKPSRDAVEALDLLSGDLPVCEAAPVSRMAPPPKVSLKKPADSGFSLEDIVAPTAAPSVQTERQLSSGAADALEALSDTLMDITPVPEPAPVPTRDVVKEKKVVKEKIIKMGERDDTLPPEFRLTEEEIKEMEKAEDVRPKEKPMGDAAALDLLSGDFSTPAAPAAPAAVAAPKTKSTAPPAEMPSQKGPVLDALASTLLPDAPEFRAKHSPVTDKPKESPAGDKPKAKSGKPKSRSKKQAVADTSAIDDLSEQLTSDVVPTSPAKKSSKS